MSRLSATALTGLVAVLALSACGDATGVSGATLTAVSPAPDASAVPPTTGISLTFGQSMMPGMEQYLDLHMGSIAGPTVPMACGWNAGRTALTCTPDMPLAASTQYIIHLGGGMRDAHGGIMDLGGWTRMGGQWATGGMMGGTHAGQPMGMMDNGWMHDGHYGMWFAFTTS